MITTRTWSVQIFLTDEGERTRADAVLHSGAMPELRGVGYAHSSPRALTVPEIGDELAAAEALSELSTKLVTSAALDIDALGQQALRQPV